MFSNALVVLANAEITTNVGSLFLCFIIFIACSIDCGFLSFHHQTYEFAFLLQIY